MKPIIMPQVGQDLPTGKIVQWLKQENEPVNQGEVILIVESEKATFEVEAEQSGILLKILYAADEEVDVLEPVGYIGQPGESLDKSSPDATQPPPAVPAEAARQPQQPAQPPPSSATSERPVASPSARRLAREKQIDLALVQGSGPRGRITTDDVLAAAEKGGQAPYAEGACPPFSAVAQPDQHLPAATVPSEKQEGAGEDTVVPFGRMRKRIAQRLTLSTQTIPHYYLFVDVDMTEAQRWRRSFNAEQGSQISVTDLIIKAAADALRDFPRLNAHVDGENLVIKKQIHVGVAVAVDEGLLVPVIPDADKKDLREISHWSKQNAEAARRGLMRPGPPGTFTISSLGMYAVKQFVPIINPPECAILAVGAVEPRVVAMPRGIGVRDMMTLTLACDHRAVDGADAAGLLQQVKSNLERIQEIYKQWS